MAMAIYRGYELYNMTKEDILDAIQSACDFFQIPMPAVIRNQTGDIDSITGFFDCNRSSYFDDEIRFNMDQLVKMNVETKQAFSLVMTHECAHRVFQNTFFPGLNGGAWEKELCADFFMGVRAGIWKMDDISMISVGLCCVPASPTHPEGTIRALFVRYGKYCTLEMREAEVPLTIQNLYNKFSEYLVKERPTIMHFQKIVFG